MLVFAMLWLNEEMGTTLTENNIVEKTTLSGQTIQWTGPRHHWHIFLVIADGSICHLFLPVVEVALL